MKFFTVFYEQILTKKFFTFLGILGLASAIALLLGYFSTGFDFYLIRGVLHLLPSLILLPFMTLSKPVKAASLLILTVLIFLPV